MLDDSFISGALSFNAWKGQPDTCWSNVHSDANEYSDGIVKNIQN